MGPNKAVHLMFLSGGIILFFLLFWTGEWIVGAVTRHPNEYLLQGVAAAIALGAGIALYRNERVYSLASEVATELKKVTWPTRKETQAATLVVIVTVIVAAILLGSFDMIWSWVTDRIYG
jgi:preprotein translocase SecE subunit